jgi:RNA polymerase sigma factor (sigma-70 family)
MRLKPEVHVPPTRPSDLGPSSLSAMTPKDIYEANLALVDRAIAFACRRKHLSGPEGDDFRQSVHVKLMEDDCKVFRSFRGDRGAALETYLAMVVQRHLVDWQRRRWGKWRPSAVARRIGGVAPKLDELIWRDGLSVDAACETLLTNHHVDVPRAELVRIAKLLPPRQDKQSVDDEELDGLPAAVERPEGRVLESELRPMHERLLAELEKALGELPADDRLLVEMCVIRGRTIAEAARFLSRPQKPLYRRREQALACLRRALEAEGFSWKQVAEILGIPEVRWD